MTHDHKIESCFGHGFRCIVCDRPANWRVEITKPGKEDWQYTCNLSHAAKWLTGKGATK